MKQIISKLAILFLAVVSCCACSNDDEEQNARLSVVDFYPSIVMEGINLTVVGTDVKSVKEVVFPSGVIATDITVKDEYSFEVTVPAGVSEEAAPLIVRGEGEEVSSRQTIRRAKPAFNSFLFTDKKGAAINTKMSILGKDLLFVDAVAFMVNGEKRMVDNKHLLRKSNDDIKFIIPYNFDKGDVVSLQLIFKNGETMDLDEKIDIVIPWQNPFALCDPITDETFMITDFEHEDPANGVSDIKASGFVAVHEEQSEDDFFWNNTYIYTAEDTGSGDLFICHVHGNRPDGDLKMNEYEIKLDVRIDEGTFGASLWAGHFDLGWTWCWIGNFFPESTDGKWITVKCKVKDLGIGGDFDTGHPMGQWALSGLIGPSLPAGISLDNFRMDPLPED